MKKLFLLLSVAAVSTPMVAQLPMGTSMDAAALTQEETERLERMTANTQRITFIDSIVADKADFLAYYNLNPEAGTIARHQDFFHTRQHSEAYVYANEKGNCCYFPQTDNTGKSHLYFTEVIDRKWAKPQPLKGINDQQQFSSINYPFMMPDGQTLYFAAKGEGSIGGYDIFVTRYDAEGDRFLKPENIGMPFNSTANDYMFVIDEYGSLGWFATDRNQQEGKVCIYIFIPTETRQTYDAELYTPEQIERFARIDAIADTWDEHNSVADAKARLATITQRKLQLAGKPEFTFVINNHVTYSRLTDFQRAENRKRFEQLQRLYAQHKVLSQALAKARAYYAEADAADRKDLQPDMIESEQRLHQLYLDIKALEKTIRNEENKIIKAL